MKGNFLSHAGLLTKQTPTTYIFAAIANSIGVKKSLSFFLTDHTIFDPPIKIPLLHRIFPPELLAMHLRGAATKNYHRSFTSFFTRVRSFLRIIPSENWERPSKLEYAGTLCHPSWFVSQFKQCNFLTGIVLRG